MSGVLVTMAHALAVVVVLGSGIAAGVLFAVAVSVVPALRDLPPDRYVQVHQLLGRNWDPTMPIIVLGSTAGALALSVLGTGALTRLLFALGAVALFASSMVSHLRNVPLNRQVKRLDPALPLPADWRDPRPEWRRWHLLRTALAAFAFVAIASAVVRL
jgi:uncharacterized membrane protein